MEKREAESKSRRFDSGFHVFFKFQRTPRFRTTVFINSYTRTVFYGPMIFEESDWRFVCKRSLSFDAPQNPNVTNFAYFEKINRDIEPQ